VQSGLEEGSSRRENQTPRPRGQTRNFAPESSEILQQIQDPLLLALPKLLVLPIPDVLRVLCGGEGRQTPAFE